MDDTGKEIIAYYNNYDEETRLEAPYGMLEAEHTKRLIERHIGATPLDIYDIGAGTGHYAAWLADLGQRVHFSDIVPDHVEAFRKRHGLSEGIVSIQTEDARKLSYGDGVADLVILNGPLYHLTERQDRLMALREARRILKRNGRLLAFSISRFAGMNYALSSGEIFNDDYYHMVRKEISSGVRDNSAMKNKTFTKAYFHSLEEIEAELRECGLAVENSFGVGLAWSPPDLVEILASNFRRERLLEVAGMLEKYPMQGIKILTVGTNTQMR